MEYRCKETWCVEICDDNGFTLEDAFETIEEGSVWIEDNDPWRLADGEVRLLAKGHTYKWLEIPKETLNEYFELTK